jgi:hypothetical protein
MGNGHNSRIFNTDMMPLSINKFIEYDTHIKNEFSKSSTNNNINGLKCYDSSNKINYSNSEFGTLHYYIKSYYTAIIKTKLIISFLSVFLNEKSNKGIYIHDTILFKATDKIRLYYLSSLVHNNNNKTIDADMILYNKLYNKSINFHEESNNLDEPYKEASEDLNEAYIKYFNDMLHIARQKPVGFLNYINIPFMRILHCISIIVFYDKNTYYFKIYDPMFYKRKDKSYVVPLIIAYIYIELLANKKKIKVDIENISETYCVKSDKGIHCSQYVIDAEYCSMYSLYFLFLFGKNNFDITNEGLKKIVDETFISNPTDLKRNQCIESNHFRIVFMSFIMTILIIISDDEQLLNLINSIKNRIINYKIIHSDIEVLLNSKLLKIQKSKTKHNSSKNFKQPNPPKKIVINRYTKLRHTSTKNIEIITPKKILNGTKNIKPRINKQQIFKFKISIRNRSIL